MPFSFGNLGSAAMGASQGLQLGQEFQLRQFQLEQARQQAARQQAAMDSQRAADAAYRQALQSVYGPPATPELQTPMPGQASVPMVQPAQQMPMGTTGTPPIAPYRAMPTAGGALPEAAPQSVQLPPRPARQQLDMQTVMANAPADPDAFTAYMERMSPLLSSQSKAELEETKLDLRRQQMENQLLTSEQRIANATTPAERKAALEANMAIRQQMVDIARERAQTQAEAAGTKVTAASEKRAQSDEARKQAIQLVNELKISVAQNPGVVGIRGTFSRGAEAVKGAFGSQDSAAHDFQQKVRMLQNIVKQVEPYGPEGRVLKGELADRDQIVQGLGAWTSAPNALSSFDTLEKFLTRTYAAPATPPGGAAPTAPATPAKPVPKDRNRVIKDILTANNLNPNNPDDVKRATEFAKSEGLIK